MPTTKLLQTHGLHITNAIETVQAAHQKLGIFKKSLNECFQEADQFIINTNSLINNDEEIALLESECCIRLPVKDEKQQIINKITTQFQHFIDILLKETEERILNDINEMDTIYKEMVDFDPTSIISNDQCVNVRKLCEINNIANEYDCSLELKAFASEFLSYQNRSKYESVLHNDRLFISNNSLENNGDDFEHDDDELIHVVVETESDIIETTADLRVVDTISLNMTKCQHK